MSALSSPRLSSFGILSRACLLPLFLRSWASLCATAGPWFFLKVLSEGTFFGGLKITSASTERQKRSQNSAPVLVIISGSSLIFPRKIITSTGFYRCCALGAPAPVVVKNQSPISRHLPESLPNPSENPFREPLQRTPSENPFLL